MLQRIEFSPIRASENELYILKIFVLDPYIRISEGKDLCHSCEQNRS